MKLTNEDFHIDFERARLYIAIKRIGEKNYNHVPKQIISNQEIVERIKKFDMNGMIDCANNCGYDNLSGNLCGLQELLARKEKN